MPFVDQQKRTNSRLSFFGSFIFIALLVSCNHKNLQLSETPNNSLTPEEVVISQLKALQINDHPRPDHGISVAFAFASPLNKQNTGPLDRFKKMLTSPAYRSMINCEHFKVSKHFIDYNEAQFFVKISNSDGSSSDFIFELSKQIEGEYKGFWMTEAVIPIKDKIKLPNDQLQKV